MTDNGKKGKIKVLYIHHGKVLGGAPVSLLNTILGLKKTPFIEMKVLCAHREMEAFFSEHSGVKVGRIYNPCLILGRVFIGMASLFNPRTLAMSVYELFLLPFSIIIQLRELKNEAPDIVHLNSSILLSTAIAANLAGIPLIWHVREVVIGGRFNIRKRLISRLIRMLSKRVIAISPFEAENLGIGKKDNIRVVYNFIDFKKFDPTEYNPASERQKLGFSKDDIIILSLGGVSFRKGAVQIIESAPYTGDDVKYVVAGPPPPTTATETADENMLINIMLRLEDMLVASGLKAHFAWFYAQRVANALNAIKTRAPKKIIFIGHVKDIAPIIASCDILVFAGTTPHFPRPVYEAWAMKKPVIAFDMKGVSQNIEDGIDGVVVKEKTGRAMAEAIQRLLRSRDKMQSMGGCGHIKARQRFSLENNIKDILNIYRGVMEECYPNLTPDLKNALGSKG